MKGYTMEQQVHGHEVMQMMVNGQGSYTRETLLRAIIDRFGESTRFYTCSAENMTATELIDFLESRGKFVESGNGFTTLANKICNH